MNKLLNLSLVALLAGAAATVDAAPRGDDWRDGRGRHGHHQRDPGQHGRGYGYRDERKHGRRDDYRKHGNHRGHAYRPYRRYDRHDHHHRHVYRYPAPAYYVRPHGYRSYRWTIGHHLPRHYYGPAYYVDYRPYRLAPPPYGHHWVRVHNDVFLVALGTGLIVDSIYGLFYDR